MRYDTVIIGAGLSGLAAGIRLAYYEKSVCVLERHTTIGGLNSFYRLRGRNHDVGLHAVTNYAPPGTKTGPLSKLLRQLRMKWDDFNLAPQNESAVVFPGHRLRFNNEFAFFEEQIAAEFPSQIDGFRRLALRIEEHDELNLNRRESSARAVLGEHLGDPVLIDMLFCPLMFYGSPTPHDMDFNQFVIMFKAIFREGFARPPGGIRPLLKAVVRKFRTLGGELRLRAGVKRLHSVGGRVTEIELDDGERLEADNVLSSAGSVETMRLCEEEGAARPDQRDGRGDGRATLDHALHSTGRATHPGFSIPGEISFVETIFSLDCQPHELGHDETIIFYNDAERFHYECPQEACDVRSGIICSPNNFQYDPASGPEDGRIRITALARPDFWMNRPTEEDYVAEKDRWCGRIAESALRHVPDFRAHVVDTDMFTPRTIRHFTGHDNGAVYGAPHKHVDGRTHLSNLFLCGTDQGFLGIIGSMLSGISMANAYLLK
ncbi:MAG: phytoene desaturase family protein [Planctomycetaceae bacterium]